VQKLHISDVNIINVLNTRFLYVIIFGSFSLVTFGFVIFDAKILYEKLERITLMKLTPGLQKKSKLGRLWVHWLAYVPLCGQVSFNHIQIDPALPKAFYCNVNFIIVI